MLVGDGNSIWLIDTHDDISNFKGLTHWGELDCDVLRMIKMEWNTSPKPTGSKEVLNNIF